MRCHELAVEQAEPGKAQPRDQPCERNLRRIGTPRHHAFPEKGTAERYAIKAADQVVALPDLDRMGKALIVQTAIGTLDRAVDPGRRPVGRRLRAERNDAGKGAVGGHRETLPPDRLGERARQAETLQWQDRALLRLHPINIACVPVVRHGKYAERISAEQQQRIDHHLNMGLNDKRPAKIGWILHGQATAGSSSRMVPSSASISARAPTGKLTLSATWPKGAP